MMRHGLLFTASVFTMAAATSAHAQVAQQPQNEPTRETVAPQAADTMAPPTVETADPQTVGSTDIVVTAQRRSQSLQKVPIAVTAFSSEALEKQQIRSASDLQLTLPNVSFTKTNFADSSFTIRGIGDLCVGDSCEAATAIHVNGSPLFATRIFETEYFDLERIEVLRGPQGTLFGRSATSGVVNVITAKPDLHAFGASADVEYGNYNSVRTRAMVNLPISSTLGVRVAGYYLNRDGYTYNAVQDSRIDGRDEYSIRGSLRWEPSSSTTVDLMGSYFREKDDRLRIQKQMCQRDPTGVLGCLNGRLDYSKTNFNATSSGTLLSQQFVSLALGPQLGSALSLGSVYGPDSFAGYTEPADPRVVNTYVTPTYFTDELQIQGRIDHDFGPITAQFTGLYQRTNYDASQDYSPGIASRSQIQPALNALAALGAGAIPGLPASYFSSFVNAIIPDGPNGKICTSLPDPTSSGIFSGKSICGQTPLALDRSNRKTDSWSAEAIFTSKFDGRFNFLLGGIYSREIFHVSDYDVSSFGSGYLSGLYGSFTSLDAGVAPSFLATPFFYSSTDRYRLNSYGIFGESYFDISDRLKLTVGLRYNNDNKSVVNRTSFANFLAPYTTQGSPFTSPFAGSYDADPVLAGNQPFVVRDGQFDAFTGRAVLDYQFTPHNLLYASYSRGYKSGGFNPAVQSAGITVPDAFGPEHIDAFEIGSKNTFANGALTLNLTGFFYRYKGLQLARIVAQTAINDNIDAQIYGLEAEAIVRPAPNTRINIGASYLHTEVLDDTKFVNQRDPSGGNPNSVIVKDLSAAYNCAVVANTGGAATAVGFVNAVNNSINASQGLTTANGLRPATAFPSDANLGTQYGAFSLCSTLADAAAGTGGAISVYNSGVPVSIRGNKLPQAPTVKFSIGIEQTIPLHSGWTLVPRLDLTYTGEQYGSIFNGFVNKIPGYEQANAQIQLNGRDDAWYVRAFVQNIFDNNAITGLYLTDQSSGLYTNVFTLDPRRYGIAAGIKF